MTPRYRYYNYYQPTRRIETDEGIRARSKRGKFAKSWWAKRWISALEQLVDAGRLRRGRSYARSGQVLSIDEEKGGIQAKVQGSRARPYRVSIELAPLTDEQWDAVIDVMSAQAIFAAQLLAGEMPVEIEEVFAAAGVSLFPDKPGDLVTDCSCPDWANPCKHVAATHYILGEQFDEDPFMIFRLRGRTQEQVLEALRSRRAAESSFAEDSRVAEEEIPYAAVPLDELVTAFWQPAEPMDHFSTAIKPPPVTLPLLRRLGPPAFLPDDDLTEILAPAYQAITERALETAYDSDARADERASEEA